MATEKTATMMPTLLEPFDLLPAWAALLSVSEELGDGCGITLQNIISRFYILVK